MQNGMLETGNAQRAMLSEPKLEKGTKLTSIRLIVFTVTSTDGLGRPLVAVQAHRLH